MKILFLSAANSTHTVRWVNALVERGHELYLVSNYDHKPKLDLLDQRVNLYLLKHRGTTAYYFNAFELKNLVVQLKPDVINVHYASGYGTLARIAKIGPVLLSVWGSDVYEFPYQSQWKSKVLKKNLLYAKEIAATSNCMAEQVKQLLGDKNKHVTVTPFGVNLELFKYKEKQRKDDRIVIGNVKTLKKVYGIDDLVKAFAEVKEQLGNTVDLFLEIYGEGEERRNIEKLIRQLKMDRYVALKGKISNENVQEALQTMDIFCVTSLRESFGVSLIEAMAAGVPIVATDTEGFKEIVTDGENGMLVKRGDVGAIADGLKKLILSKELRERYRIQGRKRAEECYDWRENVYIMEMLYQNIKEDKEKI